LKYCPLFFTSYRKSKAQSSRNASLVSSSFRRGAG
jgi:hypothetical protein